MAAISITLKALEAIKATLSELDNAAPFPGPDGLVRVLLDRVTVDRLCRLPGPGESYSDVILRLAETNRGCQKLGNDVSPCFCLHLRNAPTRLMAVSDRLPPAFTGFGNALPFLSRLLLACHWVPSGNDLVRPVIELAVRNELVRDGTLRALSIAIMLLKSSTSRF
jgi:hypothetical protein